VDATVTLQGHTVELDLLRKARNSNIYLGQSLQS